MLKNWGISGVILGTLLLGACSRIPSTLALPDLKPAVQQTTNPGGSVHAVLTYRGYGGGPGGIAYLVYIYQTGASKAYLTLTGLHLKSVAFSWASNHVLDISMACGDVQEFSNFFYFYAGNTGREKKVTINLKSQGNCPPYS